MQFSCITKGICIAGDGFFNTPLPMIQHKEVLEFKREDATDCFRENVLTRKNFITISAGSAQFLKFFPNFRVYFPKIWEGRFPHCPSPVSWLLS